MSGSQNETSYKTNNYTMLGRICGNASGGLGAGAVAPTYTPSAFGLNPTYQFTPVFKGADYSLAPYQYNLLTRCGNCGNTHCTAEKAYPCNDDGVAYVKNTPSQMINQTCAVQSCASGFKPSVSK